MVNTDHADQPEIDFSKRRRPWLRVLIIGGLIIILLPIVAFSGFVAYILYIPYSGTLNIERKANQGDTDAQLDLAAGYRTGRLESYSWGRIRKDRAKALFWYKTAAHAGSATAAYLIGCMDEEDNPGAKDGIALHWYKVAAIGGNADAQKRLSEIYEAGLLGEPMDTEKARYWYQKAMTQAVLGGWSWTPDSALQKKK